MADVRELYNELKKQMREAFTLESIFAILDFDGETIMPDRAEEFRGEQAAMIQGLRHDKLTGPRVGELLETIESMTPDWGADSVEAVNIREWRRDYDQQVKLPRELVEAITSTGIRGRAAWTKARAEDNFGLFEPWLEKQFDLQKQAADALGYETEAYDALMDQYEAGAKTAEVAEVFAGLRAELVPLIQALQEAPRQPDMSKLQGSFDVEKQKEFNRKVVSTLGFDFERGAIGITTHPFCITLGPHDIRITTRYEENRFDTAFSSTVHEGGHAMYEQNVSLEDWATPAGTPVSLGVHESQSRFWENQVGRTRAFWSKWYPVAQETFPGLKDVAMEDYLFAMNAAQPSLIRVDADELTYNLHIMIRFELERAVLNGELAVKDIPEAWNEKYREYLGVEVPNNSQGCLQDIHWSIGIMGYFPTYALGNIYAAQFTAALEKQLGSLDDLIAREAYPEILGWLRENIHRHGRRYTPKQIVEQVTGEAPTSKYLVDYLKNRFGGWYGIEL